MRYLIFAAVAAVMVSASAGARELGTKIAMGPTSAAHLPSGQQRGNPSPDCPLPYDQCPDAHKKPKYRHTKPKHSYHDHFID